MPELALNEIRAVKYSYTYRERKGRVLERETEEMEEMEVELVLEAREVDKDYEFEAPMFFDFTREESLAEARAAERWFDSAPSYPPSREFLEFEN